MYVYFKTLMCTEVSQDTSDNSNLSHDYKMHYRYKVLVKRLCLTFLYHFLEK